MTARGSALDRIYELDLLRFFAALSVLFFHYGFCGYVIHCSTAPFREIASWAKYGFMGLPLFFMISGFVILGSALDTTPKRFFISRVARLYPAFWLACTLTTLFTLWIGQELPPVHPAQYFANMTMLGGFFKVKAVDGVYWTLFVEIRFYFLVWLALSMRQIHRSGEILGLWLAVFFLSLLFRLPGRLQDFFILMFAPYFIAGALFYLIRRYGFSIYRMLLLAASFLASLISTRQGLFVFISDHFHAELNWSVLAATIVVFFFIFFLLAAGKRISFLDSKALFLGTLTYPLYLLHQHVGYMIFNRLYPRVNEYLLFALIVLGLLALSRWIHLQVEKPLSGWIKKF